MKTTLWRLGWLLATTLALGGTPARAGILMLTTDHDEPATVSPADSIAVRYAPEAKTQADDAQGYDVAAEQTAQAGTAATCGSCGNSCGCCSKCCEWLGPFADPWPLVAGYGFSGLGTFRGVSDGTFQNNNGFVNGFNIAAPIPLLSEAGFAWQSGMSYGVYDLSGRASAPPFNQQQQQIFVTTGFFRRADSYIPISGGLVYDWNINNNFGTFANSPTLGQWRGQLALALGDFNEIGFWGTLRDRGDQKLLNVPGPFLQNYKAISQGNVFFHHKFQVLQADSWVYVGIPDRRRLAQGGDPFFPAGAGKSLGQFIIGQNWLVPLTDYISLYADAMYMKPSAHPGIQLGPGGVPAAASAQEFWNLQFGVTIYARGTARSTTVAGRKWMPYMPVANNGSFMVDTNITQ